MTNLGCGHAGDAAAERVCPHLLRAEDQSFYRRFTGRGVAFDLVCPACHVSGASEWRTACRECLGSITRDNDCVGNDGAPEVRTRPTALRFRHRTLTVDLPRPILDIQPVEGEDRQRWMAWAGGTLYDLDLDRGSAEPRFELPTTDTAGMDAFRLAPDGRFAAIVQRRGQRGIVVDLETGRATMPLDRGNYHVQHCNFPASFAVVGGRVVLIHATAWNRLDVSDPLTGERLTARESPAHGTPHYLDYFHCGLTVSPDQGYVAEDGWVWSPFGVVTSWSLAAWLGGNVWESEDGPTRKGLCGRSYLWDGPLCWLDGKRLAVWGQGDDEEAMIPAARVFDVTTGVEERWFPGPSGEFFFDEHLFSCDAEHGTSVWDADTGERLLHDPDVRPTRYHRSARSCLTPLPARRFRVSRVVGQPLAASGDARRVAAGIALRGTFGELPVLADALEEAGCADAALLAHCRAPGPHGAGCWAVDRVLDASRPTSGEA